MNALRTMILAVTLASVGFAAQAQHTTCQRIGDFVHCNTSGGYGGGGGNLGITNPFATNLPNMGEIYRNRSEIELNRAQADFYRRQR